MAGLMAGMRWLILVAVTAVASITVWQYWGPGAQGGGAGGAVSAARYYCPMHPQIVSDRPGECPICHMDLEPIPTERGAGPTGPMGAAAGTGGGDAGGVGMAAGSGSEGVEGAVGVTLAPERVQRIGVATQAVVRRAVGRGLRVPGVVEAPENALAQVHVRSAGFVERVAVSQTGVRVARGQVLAWVYSPQVFQAQQELLTAHRWAGAGSPVESGIANSGSGSTGGGPGLGAGPGVSVGGVASGVAPTAGAQSSVIEAAARRNLSLLGMADADVESVLRSGSPMRAVPVRAPRAGYVTRREAVLGQYATPETVLYEIADLSRVWVIASVYERDLPRVRAGTVARFAPAGAAGPPLEARVELVEPTVSLETRTARVRLRVPNAGLVLRPGQYGDVEFDFAPEPVLTVPRDAVVDTGTQQYVFVDRGGGRFEPVRVRVGPLADGEYPVLAGLSEGDRVVVRGTFMLDSESRLQASLAPAAQPADAGALTPPAQHENARAPLPGERGDRGSGAQAEGEGGARHTPRGEGSP